MSENDQTSCSVERVVLEEEVCLDTALCDNLDIQVSEIEPAVMVEKQEMNSSVSAAFSKQLDETTSVEGKIRLCLDAMRQALSKEGAPHFRDFWNVRQLCLAFFKESISPKIRSQLWSLYIELSSESKRLKEILDEQSAFASEQIELAIQALEKDLTQQDVLLSQVSNEELFLNSLAMKEHLNLYCTLQKQTNLFNVLASRVNGLRKEVLKTEMRIRIKNKFLSRLSVCGDVVFPKRKELIQRISSLFLEDVSRFVEMNFQEQDVQSLPLYALREEIKHLQSVAKILTLGSHAFTEARLKLSGCWDKIKDKEKERKAHTQQKRQLFKQNYDSVLEKIEHFKEACQEEITAEDCQLRADEILQFMRSVELGREEVLALKEEIFKAKRAPLEKARQEEIEKQKLLEEKEGNRKAALTLLKQEIEVLIAQALDLDLSVSSAKLQELLSSAEQMTLAKTERHALDRSFKQIKDLLQEKKTQALLDLSEEDQQVWDQLKTVLEENKGRRQEIKKQLEGYRKLLGGSGLDFEKAMLYREMIESEKAALEKIDAVIEEIEEKIEEIEM